MAHVRKQIRDAAAAAVTGLATTGSRVFVSRAHTLAQTKLPALLVYTIEEASAPDTLTRPRGLARMLTVAVEALVRANAGADDEIDQIAAEVEAAMAADVTFGGLAKTSSLAGTEIAFSDEGDKPAAGMLMTFTVRYRTSQDDPETAL